MSQIIVDGSQIGLRWVADGSQIIRRSQESTGAHNLLKVDLDGREDKQTNNY